MGQDTPMIRAFRLILPLAQCLVFFSCNEELPVQEPTSTIVPTVEWKQPYELLSYATPTTIFPTDTAHLRWALYDSTIESLTVWYLNDTHPHWNALKFVQASRLEYRVPLELWTASKWKFAISRTTGADRDSSSLITIEQNPVYIIEPRDGAIMLQTDSLRIHWRSKSTNIPFVRIEYALEGYENWRMFPDLNVSDTIYTWTNPFFETGRCYTLRITVGGGRWSYVHGLAFGKFRVHYPQEGDILYRYLPVDVKEELHIPQCVQRGEATEYEFSTNGGVLWRPVEDGWTVDDEPTAAAMLRVYQPSLGESRTIGNLRIEDRSTTYFSLQKGMQMRYRSFGFTSSPTRTDTGLARWLIVRVEDEVVLNGRTDYVCTVSVVDDSGNTIRTSSQMLWQEHSGQQMIKGDFEPFSMGEIHGIHDVSIERSSGSFIHSKGPDHVDRTTYVTERGRGMASAYRSFVIGHAPPIGTGHMYVLVD